METIPTNEFPLPKDSYAAFDAISLRNLILTRLNEQGIFTDQNYIGSNLASIIDIVSYSFNTLLFYLHKTSTESTFTEAQLYENINKIVKLLDYKPIGYQTSTLSFQASANSTFQRGTYTIPRYSYITVGNIPFSFNEDISFAVPNNNIATELTDVTNKKLLYQGIYRENPLYTAAGDENETVTINITNAYVDHFNVDVYVYEYKKQKWVQYKNVPNLYTEQAFTQAFEKRLNSNGQYEIAFGDGINGKRLDTGDKVAIYFLQSLGPTGIIGPGYLETNRENAIYSGANYSSILADVNTEMLEYISSAQFSNIIMANNVGSTTPRDVETTNSIRKNAPANFKSQYRLVTKEDIESFIKINFANFVSDVKVFNNWEYTASYLKYFNDIDVSPTAFRQILLNNVLYADSCNFNNVYICGVPKVSRGSSLKYLLPAQKEIILSNIQTLKTLTTEINFIDPIFKAVAIGTKSANTALTVDDKDISMLRITKSGYSKRADRSIINDIVAVFNSFFNPITTNLGEVFDYSALTRAILAIDGISNIQTRRQDTEEMYEGLSLIMWNPTYSDLDKRIVTNNIQLEAFQFYYFEDLANLFNKIEIVGTTYGLQ
tara:strand:+ start:3474 stop:5285 length:1812 start_codon:yes stop_codon:yes gene_type:complete